MASAFRPHFTSPLPRHSLVYPSRHHRVAWREGSTGVLGSGSRALVLQRYNRPPAWREGSTGVLGRGSWALVLQRYNRPLAWLPAPDLRRELYGWSHCFGRWLVPSTLGFFSFSSMCFVLRPSYPSQEFPILCNPSPSGLLSTLSLHLQNPGSNGEKINGPTPHFHLL